MITFLFSLADRLFPPTFESIVAGLDRTERRLAQLAGAQHAAANRQQDVAAAAATLSDRLREQAYRASRVRDNIATLLGETN